MRRLRDALRGVPRGAWLCGAVASLNACAWALLVPAFHVPDETGHVAYVQHLAETSELQRSSSTEAGHSDELQRALNGLSFFGVIGNERNKPIWTAWADAAVARDLAADPARDNGGGFTSATNNPPLYYALEAAPYRAGGWGNLLDRLYLMRLLSALLTGLTVVFVYLFVRELLPGIPWSWPAAALAVAFQPLFGFIGGGVNNDNLLFLACAATFYVLARAFRHGLTPGLGAAAGACAAVGLLAKTTYLAFLPALALAFVLLIVRAGPPGRRAALRASAAALAVVALPVLLYVLVNATVWDRPLRAGGSGEVVSSVAGGGSGKPALIREQLAYFWQLYLPRLPFQKDQFAGYLPLWETWLKGFVAHFGWLDYGFPPWAYVLAAIAMGAVAAAAAAMLVRFRRRLRPRLGELATYLTAMLGLLLLIAVGGYQARLDGYTYPFEQARYLLPLLGLYGAIAGLGATAGGRRLGPAVGATIVCAAAAHSLWALLATLERYYV